MNIEEARNYCLSKPHSEESFPFDEHTLVFKVGNKMFALLPLDEFENPSINLKSDPELRIELREEYEGVLPGYHMNKKHWNTVRLNSDVDDSLIRNLINNSYKLIVNNLPVKTKKELGIL